MQDIEILEKLIVRVMGYFGDELQLKVEKGCNIESVDEIIDFVASTSVAFTDDAIEGIINIRGQIVTTVSLYEKLNFTPTIDEDSKIIVCNIEGNRIGFIVNSVSKTKLVISIVNPNTSPVIPPIIFFDHNPENSAIIKEIIIYFI